MSRWLRREIVPAGPHRWPWPRQFRFAGGGRYEFGAEGSGWIADIPEAFVFDNSAPWWLRWALPRKAMRAACGLHDYARQDPAWSLWFGNLAFVDAMKAEGVREPFLTVCWWAVRSNRRRA